MPGHALTASRASDPPVSPAGRHLDLGPRRWACAPAVVSCGWKPYATIPAIGLWFSFVEMQKWYAIVGAFFVPVLAAVLLLLNGRRDLLPPEARNSWLAIVVLLAALAFLAVAGVYEVLDQFR